MSSINIIQLSTQQQVDLLSKFPLAWQDKLKIYTGEELFYFYKLCTLTVKKGESGLVRNMFFLALKSKFYRWMDGKEKYPIYGDAWIKLHHKFRYVFELYAGVDMDEPFDLGSAKIAYAREKAEAEGFDTTKAVNLLVAKFKRLA